MLFLAIVTTAGGFAGLHANPTGSVHVELWQVINLVGAPLLAMLFARPVIDDIRAWLSSDRD